MTATVKQENWVGKRYLYNVSPAFNFTIFVLLLSVDSGFVGFLACL